MRTTLGGIHSGLGREEWIARNDSPVQVDSTNSSSTSGKRLTMIFSFSVEKTDCSCARVPGVWRESPFGGRRVALPPTS